MIKETLSANQHRDFEIDGNYLYVFDAGGPIEVVLRGGRSSGEVHRLERKTIINGKDFSSVRVRDLSGVTNSFELWNGLGDYRPSVDGADVKIDGQIAIDDSTPVEVNVINPTAEATIVVANDNAHLANVNLVAGAAAVQIAPANANRKSVRVAIASDQVGAIALGKAGLLSNQGGLLEPGTIEYIDSEGALFARNDNVSDVVVWVMEINRI